MYVCEDTPIFPASSKASKYEIMYLGVDYVCSPGPGQYNLSVKSTPQMALISSREDRFKVSMNTNPGPGTYQVNMLLKVHLTLQHSPSPLHDSLCR